VAAAAIEPRFASPESYTPKHLAEKILTSKAALEGERKQVTVLFADLKGSMELLADRDPEEARRLLDPVLTHMMEAVHRYEGTVNQVMGDGIMALFGAPLAHEDHAVRACYAALRMQDTMKRYAEDGRREPGLPIRIRVGLNSGEVVVRSIGSDLHMDYTAVGHTTHLAARMEQLAMAGSILIAPDTLRLVQGLVDVNRLGTRAVKGLSDPIDVHELVGAGPTPKPLQVAASRGLTPFVERGREMTLLHDALEQARRGLGQVVTIVAEPGLGKSRLAYEFTRSSQAGGWFVLVASSVSYGKTLPYSPIIDLLKSYFRIEAPDDVPSIRDKVTDRIRALDLPFDEISPPVLWLLDALPSNDAFQALEPAIRRRRIRDAVKHVLLRKSQDQPLLLVFEDLHWIDSETQACLDTLVEGLPMSSTMLLATYRPEYQHAWGKKTYYRQLRIDPLLPRGAGDLLTSLLGHDVALSRVKRLLVERSEGNPFFLEETVRSLVETAVLSGERGAYRLMRPPDNLEIPATAQAIVAARIDRLAPEDKRLLQSASVVGKDVSITLLQEIAGLPGPMIHESLERLQNAEFLYEVQLFPELEFSFKHAVTHEVAYRSLLKDRRLELHARLVSSIERLHADRLGEHVEQLAYHAFRGAQWPTAARYLHEAAKRSLYRAAYGTASRLFEQTLVALQHLDDREYAAVASIDVRLALQRALFAQGEVEQAIPHLEAAEVSARALADDLRLSHVLGSLAFTLLSHGDLDRALPLAFEALSRAQRPGDRARAALRVGQVQYALGQYQSALEAFRQSIHIADTLPETERSFAGSDVSVLARSSFAMASADLGLFEDGQRRADEAIALAQQINVPVNTQLPLRTDSSWNMAVASTYAGYLYLRRGSFAAALQILEPAFALCQSFDMVALGAPSGGELATAYAVAGRVDEAKSILSVARAMALSVKFGGWHPLWLTCLGEGFAAAGQAEEATELAKKALHLASTQGARGYQAYALRTLGDAAKDDGDAATYYLRSLMLAEKLSLRPLMAHCHFGLGKVYRRTGKQREAQEHLATGETMYREMDMRSWLEGAE
jgi:class 3 adenylate cyclase/tetratricopeptide (TPR) repeat protein